MIKRWTALLSAALLVCALTACAAKTPPAAGPTPAPTPTPGATQAIQASAAPAAVALDAKTAVAWANWSDDPLLAERALNKDSLASGAPRHIPVYACGTAEELAQHKATFSGILEIAGAWDEVPSLDSVTAACDDAFFAEHALLLAYVEAPSCTFRFDVRSVVKEGGALRIHVCQTNDPEAFDTAMAGWWMVVTLKKADLSGIQSYDAILE